MALCVYVRMDTALPSAFAGEALFGARRESIGNCGDAAQPFAMDAGKAISKAHRSEHQKVQYGIINLQWGPPRSQGPHCLILEKHGSSWMHACELTRQILHAVQSNFLLQLCQKNGHLPHMKP
jgi:hypothetical protein